MRMPVAILHACVLADRHHLDRRVSVIRRRDAAEEVCWDLRGHVRHHMVLNPEATNSSAAARKFEADRSASNG